MKEGLVSIVTPLYNSEKFIEETIVSVLNQTYSMWEMLIVDDCSSDNGSEIVKKYAQSDERIKYIKMDVNSGAAKTRNKAIEISQGEYIAFLDSDDLWEKNKLEKQVEFMKNNNYSVTFTDYEEINEVGDKLNILIRSPKKPVTYRRYLLTNPIGCLTGMYSVKKLGKIYMPLLRNREDTAFWLRILKIPGVKAFSLKENLALYRLRGSSLSANKYKLLRFHWHLYRNIEKLSILESVFYMGATIVTKIFKIKEEKIIEEIARENNIENN